MKYDIEALKRKMLVKYPFFGSVIANVEYKESKEIGTAGTDGKIIYYNPEFLEKLSTPEQTFVFAHEVCHIAFNHILRSEGKNQKIWNIATDAVINQFLKRDGLKIVDGGVDIEDAINYDSEELYEKLLKEHDENKQSNSESKHENNQGNSEAKQNNESKQESINDTHGMWSQAVKEHIEQNSNSEFKEKQEEQNSNGEFKEKQEELESMGERESFKKNITEKKRKLEELKESISKQALSGSSSLGEERSVNNIGYSKPIVDWRYILRESVNYELDWSYKNATVEEGVLRPNLEETLIPETEIVLDTSGSINEELLGNFLRECKNILKFSKLRVGTFDVKFYGFHEIRCMKDIENMKFIGGGGTDFNAAVNAFSKRVDNKIIFTDGYACMPKMKIDAIWIVFGINRINPNGGKVIYITEEQLYELQNNKRIRRI